MIYPRFSLLCRYNFVVFLKSPYNCVCLYTTRFTRCPEKTNLNAVAEQLNMPSREEMLEAGDLDGFVLTFPDAIEGLMFFGLRGLRLLAAASFAQPASQAAEKNGGSEEDSTSKNGRYIPPDQSCTHNV